MHVLTKFPSVAVDMELRNASPTFNLVTSNLCLCHSKTYLHDLIAVNGVKHNIGHCVKRIYVGNAMAQRVQVVDLNVHVKIVARYQHLWGSYRVCLPVSHECERSRKMRPSRIRRHIMAFSIFIINLVFIFSAYNSETNSETFNVFQAGAFRFGHSQVPNNIRLVDKTFAHAKTMSLAAVSSLKTRELA